MKNCIKFRDEYQKISGSFYFHYANFVYTTILRCLPVLFSVPTKNDGFHTPRMSTKECALITQHGLLLYVSNETNKLYAIKGVENH